MGWRVVGSVVVVVVVVVVIGIVKFIDLVVVVARHE